MTMTRREALGMIAGGAVGVSVFGVPTLATSPSLVDDPHTLQGKPDIIEAPNYLLWRRREGDTHIWTIETMHKGEPFGLTGHMRVAEYVPMFHFSSDEINLNAARCYMDSNDQMRVVSPEDVDTCETLLDMMNRPQALVHRPLLTTQVLQARADVIQMWPPYMQRFADHYWLGKPRQWTRREHEAEMAKNRRLHYVDPVAMYPNLFRMASA